jgi:hypothetical protein
VGSNLTQIHMVPCSIPIAHCFFYFQLFKKMMVTLEISIPSYLENKEINELLQKYSYCIK